MVRRYRRSIYDELDELRASMDYLYQLALDPGDEPQWLPEDPTPIVCRSLHNLDAEVSEQEEGITVTVDLAPGTGNAGISVSLPDETTLKITCDHEEEQAGHPCCDRVQEQRSLSLHHLIPLPARVMIPGARLSLRHNVLDLYLKKVPAD